MEWAIGIPILLLLLVCPLMMVGMIVGGWVMGRRATGDHGSHPSDHETAGPTGDDLVEELKAERQRLDELIARAERGGAR